MEERLKKPVLILQAERALIEIAILRDAITGDAQQYFWRFQVTLESPFLISLKSKIKTDELRLPIRFLSVSKA